MTIIKEKNRRGRFDKKDRRNDDDRYEKAPRYEDTNEMYIKNKDKYRREKQEFPKYYLNK